MCLIRIRNFFDAKLFFYESNNLIVEAKITGKLENPSIKILNSNNLLQDENLNNDLKTIFELGVENIIENIKGDFFNVMGFPLFPFLLFLKKFNIKK